MEKGHATVKLWRAVILQAILDRLTQSKRGECINGRKSAKNWIRVDNKNFCLVCKFAELEPDFVVRQVSDALIHHEKWRRKCDIGKGLQFLD